MVLHIGLCSQYHCISILNNGFSVVVSLYFNFSLNDSRRIHVVLICVQYWVIIDVFILVIDDRNKFMNNGFNLIRVINFV